MSEEKTTIVSAMADYLKKNWKPVLVFIVLLIVLILMVPCHGCQYLSSKWGSAADSGQPKISENDGCPACDDCIDYERLRKVVKEAICEVKEEGCGKTEEVKPDACSALGPGWSCRDTRGLTCQESKPGLCPGPSWQKCVKGCVKVTGSRPSQPSVSVRTPTSPKKEGKYREYVIETDVPVTKLYGTAFDNPNVKIVNVSSQGAGRDREFAPTQRIVVRVPDDGRLDHFNVRTSDGQWSVDHGGARLEGNREVSNPRYNTRVNGKQMTRDNAVKKGGDWSYNYDSPTPRNDGASSGDGVTFDVSR